MCNTGIINWHVWWVRHMWWICLIYCLHKRDTLVCHIHLISHMHTQTVTQAYTHTEAGGCHQVGQIVINFLTRAGHVHTYITITHSKQYAHCFIIHAYIHLFMPHVRKSVCLRHDLKVRSGWEKWFSDIGMWQICACLVKCGNFHADSFSMLN